MTIATIEIYEIKNNPYSWKLIERGDIILEHLKVGNSLMIGNTICNRTTVIDKILSCTDDIFITKYGKYNYKILTLLEIN